MSCQVCPKLTNYSSSNSSAETQRRGGFETRTTTRTKQTCRARLMCFSEVCVPASVLPSWRVHTCFCSLCAPSETAQSFILLIILTQSGEIAPIWHFSSVDACLRLSRDFDGKHLKVRTPSLVTRLTKETTSCHYWKRKRQKSVGHKQEQWLTFFISLLSSILSYRGFPSPYNLSLTFLTAILSGFFNRQATPRRQESTMLL